MTNNKPRYNIALFKRGILTLQCFCCCEWCFGREVRGSFHKADQSVSVSSLGSESLDRAQVCALGKTVAQTLEQLINQFVKYHHSYGPLYFDTIFMLFEVAL